MNFTKGKQILSWAMAAVLMAGCVGHTEIRTAQAANSKKAYLAYKKYLSKNRDNWLVQGFGFLDANRDGVPELITGDGTGNGAYHLGILAYVNGKVKEVGGGFSGTQIFYPNKHLYYSTTCHTGVSEYNYFRFNGKKMVKLAQKYGCDSYNAVTGKRKSEKEIETAKDIFAPYKYTVLGKRVSKKKYKAYVKNLKKGAKEKEFILVANNAKNRKAYVK